MIHFFDNKKVDQIINGKKNESTTLQVFENEVLKEFLYI